MIFGLLFIMLVIYSFWYTSKQKRKELLKRSLVQENYYIKLHQAKLRHDKFYNDYLTWCGQHNQIPMNKQSFIKSIEDKEKEIENLYK